LESLFFQKGGIGVNRFLQNRYAMTPEGARDLNKSIWWTVLQFLSFMLPIMVCTFFTRDVLRVFSGKAQNLSWSIWAYVGISLVILTLIYIINYIQYGSTYTRIYDESAKTRIRLAETLRQLPLSLGKRTSPTFPAPSWRMRGPQPW
jgi:ATP-binding cassette subfamily B protein